MHLVTSLHNIQSKNFRMERIGLICNLCGDFSIDKKKKKDQNIIKTGIGNLWPTDWPLGLLTRVL